MRSLVSASALTCLLLPAAAQAFPIDLEAHLDGVTIETRTTDISNIATVTLRNAGANTALCEATFVNGPERPAPRRVALLQQLELPFEQLPSPEEELPPGKNGPQAHVVESASAKARAVHRLVQQRRADNNSPTIVIGVDTIVYLDGEIMGKPGDPEEAAHMLQRLSGHSHQVYTGLSLICADDRELRDWADSHVNAVLGPYITYQPMQDFLCYRCPYY